MKPTATNKEKEAIGLSETKMCICTVESRHISRNSELFSVVMHMSVLHRSSLWSYWSLYPIIQTSYALVGMSCDRFLLILTMFHLNKNYVKAAGRQPDCDSLFEIRLVSDALIVQFRTSTHHTNS
jgi:hypothetical protein